MKRVRTVGRRARDIWPINIDIFGLSITNVSLAISNFFIFSGSGLSRGSSIASFILVLANLILVCYVILWLFPRYFNTGAKFWIEFIMLTVGLIFALAQADWLFNQISPGGIQGLNTPMDALYFTIATMTSAGSGTISPESQGARLLVTGQVLVGFLLTAVVLVRMLDARFGKKRRQG